MIGLRAADCTSNLQQRSNQQLYRWQVRHYQDHIMYDPRGMLAMKTPGHFSSVRNTEQSRRMWRTNDEGLE